MKAKLVKEGIEDIWTDPGNKKAMGSWVAPESKTEYALTTPEPIIIKTKNEADLNKLKFIFNKYRIKYVEEVIN